MDIEQVCRSGERALAKADPVMGRLIKRHGPCPIHDTSGTMFHHLASAIIAQQLSVKAAATIQERVMKLTAKPMSPAKFLLVEVDGLRAAGLSKQKVSYIRNLAEAMEQGLSKGRLQRMSDDEAMSALTAVKGIGQWTAEMYLMFGLRRLDVVSLGDAGLQRAARMLYNGGEAEPGLLARVSENWKPYRSIACWYLWQSLD
ncbi:DNA-3-methyladenine glycosylase family protein [Pontiella desulfatans]|nr:DNA-3-methyladenine glycosylase 2 family protein [Pontiella desulfatans]